MTPLIGLALLAVGIIFLWQGPDRYSAIKGVHVAFAVLWVGGGATLTILGIAAEARNDQGSWRRSELSQPGSASASSRRLR